MSNVLTSNVHSTGVSNTETSSFKILQVFNQVAKIIIAIAASIGLFSLNYWAGLAFVVAVCAFLIKDAIAFVIHIMQSDFDLTKDIFRDLEPF